MHKHTFEKWVVTVSVGFGISVASASALAVPKTLTHQGRLYDENGEPAGGKVTLTFKVYDSESASTSVWSEQNDVTLDEGYFSVVLGQTTAFGASVFSGAARYLGITVGTDPEMQPRFPITSVPYALVAGDVTGDIHPTNIFINNKKIIDDTGKWTGTTTGLVGPQGPTGPTGGVGPAGGAGAKGATGVGVQGPAGPAGPTGGVGPAGATGAKGATGATGPSGYIKGESLKATGTVPDTTTAVTTTLSWLKTTDTAVHSYVEFTLDNANDVTFVSSWASFGGTAAASGLSFGYCWQNVTKAGALTAGNLGDNLRAPAGTTLLMPSSGVVNLAYAGDTYRVGLCAKASSTTNAQKWNQNGDFRVQLLVFRGG